MVGQDKLLATRGEAEIVSAFITEEEQKEASRDAAREMALNATTGNALIDGALFGESEGQATWIGDGVFRGVTGLGKGIITGMSGVVTNTYNGARKDGTQGLVKVRVAADVFIAHCSRAVGRRWGGVGCRA